MKKEQQKYAMSRIDSLTHDKVDVLRRSMPVIKEKSIKYGKALKLIKSGAIKLRIEAARELHNYDDFNVVFDLSGHHDYGSIDRYDKKKLAKKTAPIYKEAQRIKDQIMLGDAEEALKMILAFAKM